MFGPRYLRVVLSYVVAALATGMCALRHHVHIALRHPQTWRNVLYHRCGLVMLFCVAWSLLELIAAMVLPLEADSVLYPASA